MQIKDRDKEMVRLYQSGLSQAAVAAEIGIHQTTVSLRLRAMGVQMERRGFDPVKRAQNLAKVNEARRNPHSVQDGVVGKICRLCSEWQPLTRFCASNITLDGLENRCRACVQVKANRHYRENTAAINARRRTPEFRARHRSYHAEWEKQRRASNLNYRLAKRLRGRLWRALKGIRKEARTLEILGCSLDEFKAHLESQFRDGMSWDNYGQPGWEMDHIRPCSSFDLSDPEQLRQCFGYANIQPLWGVDNWIKGPRY